MESPTTVLRAHRARLSGGKGFYTRLSGDYTRWNTLKCQLVLLSIDAFCVARVCTKSFRRAFAASRRTGLLQKFGLALFFSAHLARFPYCVSCLFVAFPVTVQDTFLLLARLERSRTRTRCICGSWTHLLDSSECTMDILALLCTDRSSERSYRGSFSVSYFHFKSIFYIFVSVLYLLPAQAGRFFGFWLDLIPLLIGRIVSLVSTQKGG